MSGTTTGRRPVVLGPGEGRAYPMGRISAAMSVLVGAVWVEATTGSFVLVPGNVTHDFENRGSERAGMLNVSAPGNFEQHMPSIARWFAEHPPGDTRDGAA